MAAATEFSLKGKKQHHDKVQLANSLHKKKGLRAEIRVIWDVKPPHLDVEVAPDSSRPIDVDVRMFRSSEVDQKLREGDDLLGWALRFGRTIFDRNEYWASLHAKWAGRLPFPSPETSVARALRFKRFAEELLSTGDFDAALEQVVGMLTHRARAGLLQARVYPASRPELPAQLRKIGQYRLAEWLERALRRRKIAPDVLEELKRGTKRFAEATR